MAHDVLGKPCTCTMETRTGVVLDRESDCGIHGAAVVALAAAGWEQAGGSWPDSVSGRHVILGAVDAARAPLLAELVEARETIAALETYRQHAMEMADGFHAGAVEMIRERDQARTDLAEAQTTIRAFVGDVDGGEWVIEYAIDHPLRYAALAWARTVDAARQVCAISGTEETVMTRRAWYGPKQLLDAAKEATP